MHERYFSLAYLGSSPERLCGKEETPSQVKGDWMNRQSARAKEVQISKSFLSVPFFKLNSCQSQFLDEEESLLCCSSALLLMSRSAVFNKTAIVAAAEAAATISAQGCSQQKPHQEADGFLMGGGGFIGPDLSLEKRCI